MSNFSNQTGKIFHINNQAKDVKKERDKNQDNYQISKIQKSQNEERSLKSLKSQRNLNQTQNQFLGATENLAEVQVSAIWTILEKHKWE